MIPANDVKRIPRVMAVADTKLSSRLIEYWGGGGWSHFANVLADNSIIDARVDWIGKTPPGVQRRPAGYLNPVQKWAVLEIGTEAHYSAWLAALQSQLGKPYDKIGIFDFLTGSMSDRNWRDQSAWFCDELSVWALEACGICPTLPQPVFRINPGAAFLLCIGLGARVVASRG